MRADADDASQLDRLATFNIAAACRRLEQVNGTGGQTAASWASATIDNFTWYWRARTSVGRHRQRGRE